MPINRERLAAESTLSNEPALQCSGTQKNSNLQVGCRLVNPSSAPHQAKRLTLQLAMQL